MSVPLRLPSTKNSTLVTPTLSAAEAEILVVPETNVPAVGKVIEVVGKVVSVVGGGGGGGGGGVTVGAFTVRVNEVVLVIPPPVAVTLIV